MPQAQKITFEKALKSFIASVKNTKRYAQLCANLALEHYYEHNDVVHLESFLKVLDDKDLARNFVRKAAFIKWLVAHAAIKLAGGKLTMDKADTAIKQTDELLAIALITPFWEFAPEMPMTDFSAADVVKALQGVIKRFENVERTKPHDAVAIRTLAIAKAAVSQVQVPVNADLAPPFAANQPEAAEQAAA